MWMDVTILLPPTCFRKQCIDTLFILILIMCKEMTNCLIYRQSRNLTKEASRLQIRCYCQSPEGCKQAYNLFRCMRSWVNYCPIKHQEKQVHYKKQQS